MQGVYTIVNTPRMHKGHRCEKPGCGQALVPDGNMKNHWDVCSATYAGYAEFSGLLSSRRIAVCMQSE